MRSFGIAIARADAVAINELLYGPIIGLSYRLRGSVFR